MKYKDEAQNPPLPIHEARRRLADVVNRVAYARERIRLGRRGRSVAALVPVEDLELLEKLEDRIDLEAARRALKESGGKRIPWIQVKKELGL